jgi:glycosyltransferase involved in cell wall biosynthesis
VNGIEQQVMIGLVMRVLMVSKACIVGIYQRKLQEIARLGVDLRVLVPPSWRDERGETPLERSYTDGYQLEVVPIYRNGDFHTHFYGHIGRHMRDFRPQIVHIDEEPYNLATWQALWHAQRAGARALFFTWQNIQRAYPPPFAWGERWVLRRAHYALMGTESAAAVWRAKGYTGPLRVIPQFGTDTALFAPQERPPRPFTVGYFGRLVAEKGVNVLLEALAALDGDWRLMILGSGPQEADLRAQAHALGIAARLDWRAWLPSREMPALYPQVDVLALPSLTRPNWKEQFGRVLIEALASGVPCVGSDSGAIPDVIGTGGLIAPEGDVPAWTTALRRLRDDAALYADKRAAGLQHVRQFTHQAVAAATVQVYREMLGAG